MSPWSCRHFSYAFSAFVAVMAFVSPTHAASKLKTVEVKAANGLFLPPPPPNSAVKFIDRRLACRRPPGGGSFSAGVVIPAHTTGKGKKKKIVAEAWATLADYLRSQSLIPKQRSKWRSKMTPMQSMCTSVTTRCAAQPAAATFAVTENQTREFILEAASSCGLSLSFAVVSSPNHGALELNGNGAKFTPDHHFRGADGFTFKVSSSLGESAPTAITLQINPLRAEFAGNPLDLEPYRDDLTEAEVISVLKRVGLSDPALRPIRSRAALVAALLDSSESEDLLSRNRAKEVARQHRTLSHNPRFFYSDIQAQVVDRLRYGQPFKNWMGLMFWANHFATDLSPFSNADNHYDMMEHVNRVMTNATGNYRSFMVDMFGSFPFHAFITNNSNTWANPNENYGREILELHTGGINDPVTLNRNYYEEDMKASTRFVSGWNYAGFIIGLRTLGTNPAVAPQNVRASQFDGLRSDPTSQYCQWKNNKRVEITWAYTDGYRNFRIWRSLHGANDFRQVGIDWPGSAALFIDSYECDSVNGPQEGVVYDYKVQGVKTDFTVSEFSPIVSGYWGNFPGLLPASPAQITASFGTYSDKIVVGWNAVSDAVGYIVYRANHDGGSNFYQLSDVLGPSVTSFNDYAVLPGFQYHYYVRAISADGYLSREYDPNSSSDWQLLGFGAMSGGRIEAGSPRRVQASYKASPEGVTISWEPGSETYGYRIYRRKTYSNIVELVAPALPVTTTSFEDTSALPGVLYDYLVYSLNSDGSVNFARSGAGFNPVTWNESPTKLTSKTFLEWVGPNDPNRTGQILGEFKGGAYQGAVMSAFGQGFPAYSYSAGTAPQVGSFVDHLLYNWPATARNITAKLFASLAHRELQQAQGGEAIVGELARNFLAGNLETKPVLRKILSSSAMFSPQAKLTCVANPIELMIGFTRLAGIGVNQQGTYFALGDGFAGVGYDVFAPSSVFGWPNCGVIRSGLIEDGSRWTLSAQVYTVVGNTISRLLNQFATPIVSGGEGGSITATFLPRPGASAAEVVDFVASKLFVTLNEAQRTLLIQYLNTSDSGVASPWNSSDAAQLKRLTGLIRLMYLSLSSLAK